LRIKFVGGKGVPLGMYARRMIYVAVVPSSKRLIPLPPVSATCSRSAASRDPGRTSALCAHHGAARRHGQPAAVGHAMRRELDKIEAEAGARRLTFHLDETVRAAADPAPRILDVDMAVKPLCGHQEGAVVGYNPCSVR
jgi:hypothetical protein